MNTIARFVSPLFSARALLSVILTVGLAGSIPGTARGQGPFTIEDGGSLVDMNTGQQATAFNWFVGGFDHLVELSNWYRVGPTGSEKSLHTLSIVSEGTSDQDWSGQDETLTVLYDSPGLFTLEAKYFVTDGPASGIGRLRECFRVFNYSGADLDFHLFEYMDLNVNETAPDDIVTMTNANSHTQSDAISKLTFTYPTPSHHEVALFPFTRSHLMNGSTSVLNDVPGIGNSFSGGNVTWAVQWDMVIPNGGTIEICKTGRCTPANWIPEPASATLALGAVVGLAASLRRRRPAGV